MSQPPVQRLEVGDFFFFSNEKIGRGSFAQVYKGYRKQTNQVIAVKVIDMEKLTRNSAKLAEHMQLEIEIMKGLKHDNVVELLHFQRVQSLSNDSETYIYLVLEYCAGGDFAKFLSEQPNHRLSEVRTRHFLRQLACGLRFLRGRKIVHRDLKPQNLLLTSRDPDTAVLKITDFGFAKLLERDPSHALLETLCGTPMYMAPEILRLEHYDVKADLWSVGVILWETLTGRVPFRSRSPFELPQVINQTDLRIDPSLQLSHECANLLLSLLQKDSMQRIGWEEFFLHPFLGFHSGTSASPSTSPSACGTITSRPAATTSTSLPVKPDWNTSSPSNAVVSTSTRPWTVQRGFMPRPPSSNPPAVTGSVAVTPTPVTGRERSASSPPGHLVLSRSSQQQQQQQQQHLMVTPQKQPSQKSTPASGVPTVKSDPDLQQMQQMQQQQQFELLEREFVLLPGAYYSTSPSSLSSSSPESHSVATAVAAHHLIAHQHYHSPRHHPLHHHAFPETEERLLAELQTREGRAEAVLEAAHGRFDSGLPADALALYAKYLVVVYTLCNYAHTALKTKKYASSTAMRALLERLQVRFAAVLHRSREAKSRLRPGESLVPNAERLMFDCALTLGREAAVVEDLSGNLLRAEELYRAGYLLLEQLLTESSDAADQRILADYVTRFAIRLQEVQKKRDSPGKK